MGRDIVSIGRLMKSNEEGRVIFENPFVVYSEENGFTAYVNMPHANGDHESISHMDGLLIPQANLVYCNYEVEDDLQVDYDEFPPYYARIETEKLEDMQKLILDQVGKLYDYKQEKHDL